ncbi:hypothetical protein Nepgr_021968 [Nepenthes gracilis]|uniref:Dilute domain-containing protein n=1 Tax=Nepenthes gracilis TaxID=150966 RepID=A0AAD3XWD6_NEPGR|nr:hypothetical protein Nepgr_021968 [Nepenthes gracilis]
MRELEKKKNNNQINHSARTQRRDNKLLEESARKMVNAKENESKASNAKPVINVLSDTNVGSKPSEVYENMVIHYLDDVSRSGDLLQVSKTHDMVVVEDKDAILDDHRADLDRENLHIKEEDSDSETVKDPASSQGDILAADDGKTKRLSEVPKRLTKKDTSEISPCVSRLRSDHDKIKSQPEWSHGTPKKPMKSSNNRDPTKESSDKKSERMAICSSSESSEGVDDKPIEEPEEETFDKASNGDKSAPSEDETVIVEHSDLHRDTVSSNLEASNGAKNSENDDHQAVDFDHNDPCQDRPVLNRKIEEMELRIEKLEEELREVAALEISLYSVVPEHGSSAHEVHTPARRLSRLYIHACKHWTQNKRATVARNTVSGLILAARTCGNDVARLTFWLSNTVVLREIISQAFGSSRQSSPVRFAESNGSGKTSEGNSYSLKLKGSPSGKRVIKKGLIRFMEDWQETGTFTAALERIESWIFSRIVESVWWQTMTPHMQSLAEDLIIERSFGRLLVAASGDQQQGNFSINLWKNAFVDAFHRLCPVRAEGHECGCLPILATMVIEQCVARLDVAMFNAILRESAHQIPTDPISDPIVDPTVLPIPAGDLSFGSGAQLKNAVGNWSWCLTEYFGAEIGYPSEGHQSEINNSDQHAKPKYFLLLSELSDLLMLPKDMLFDRYIRKEVCPSINLPLVKRILCNFSPDEFCPDTVPGEVLEALNAESIVERRLSGDSAGGFPYSAAAVTYSPPSSDAVADKVTEARAKSSPRKSTAPVTERNGYTSDEDLEDLDSSLTSIVDSNGVQSLQPKDQIERYKLLREVWSV